MASLYHFDDDDRAYSARVSVIDRDGRDVTPADDAFWAFEPADGADQLAGELVPFEGELEPEFVTVALAPVRRRAFWRGVYVGAAAAALVLFIVAAALAVAGGS
jgi:hypothetical protein